jgi:hypothetical protein
MKLIPLRKFPTGTTGDLIAQLMRHAPQPAPGQPGGFTPDQVLAHARVLKVLREAGNAEELLLEDADHKTVLEALNASRTANGSEEMAQMILDIREAKAPSAAFDTRRSKKTAAAAKA